MSQITLEKSIIETLGIDPLTDSEKVVFLSQIADAVMESSLLRFVAGLTQEQEKSFEYYLSTEPDTKVLFGHLMEHYESFNIILEEEIIAFKEDALAVLGESKE